MLDETTVQSIPTVRPFSIFSSLAYPNRSPKMIPYRYMMALWLVINTSILFAADFNLDSPDNKGTFRFEIDNDAIWGEDSNFSNSWSLQYHTVRYATWEETRAPGFIQWVGSHFPTLGDDNSTVRNGHGIGQDIFTPADTGNPNPLPGDLPYAGTLTYTLNWQRFNRETASSFQVTAGVLGDESGADWLQETFHEKSGLATLPQGWDTQRDTEPILNLAYQYLWRLARFGEYTNGWVGQLSLSPGAQLGNLFTAAEVGVTFRFGWNMPEGFSALPAPAGRGFFSDYHLPKPSAASPHGAELVLGVRATGILYSVLYDGSLITDDDREVDREDYLFTGLIGLNYHYYQFLSIRLALVKTSNLLIEASLPPPRPGEDKTRADNSFGTLMIDFYF